MSPVAKFDAHPGYTAEDAERFLPEQHSSARSDFARDRARLLHSSALRRLAAKTQVLSPAGEEFARNRLTHSLEVAQVGREVAIALGVDPDIVETACLAHDLGHPPFGHNGEQALDAWAEDIGGFEGNAQSLRLLTRLESKVHDVQGRSLGLNLTRAVLDASIKYPWTAAEGRALPRPTTKFGVYEDDREVFEWVRQGRNDLAAPLEAQLMDFSDDVAYSVHDFEDAVLNEFIDPELLDSRAGHSGLIESVAEWSAGRYAHDELAEAFERIRDSALWLRRWNGSRKDQAQLKNFGSALIGRFTSRTEEATRRAFAERLGDGGEAVPGGEQPEPLTRYRAAIVIPAEVLAEIAVLKGIAARYVMVIDARQSGYAHQRLVLTRLAERLYSLKGRVLEGGFREDWQAASDADERKRVVVDQVASLTDATALEWFESLC